MSRFLAVASQTATTSQLTNITDTLQTAGGVMQQAWGTSALITAGGPIVAAALSAQPGMAFLCQGFAPVAGVNVNDVALALAAGWNLMQTPPFDAAWAAFAASPAHEALPSDGCGGGEQPTAAPLLPADGLAGLLGIPANNQIATSLVHRNRRALVNTIGVAILEIDGPPGSVASFQPQERVTAIAAVSRGIDILNNLAPSKAHLVFDVQIHRVQLAVDPATIPSAADPAWPTAAEYERIEKTWRDPALTALSCPTGRDGFRDLVQRSRFLFNTDWGFVLVLTKYRAAFAGYAPNYRDVVISYSMQPNVLVLPSVVAHEIGHTVGAFDEYGPKCSILHQCGFNHGPNVNCEVGNQFASVDCLMKNNASTVCLATQGHFGWGDQDFDGVLDPFDPDFISL